MFQTLEKEKIIKIAIVLVVLLAIGILFGFLSKGTKNVPGGSAVSGFIEKKDGASLILDATTLKGIASSTKDGKVFRTITLAQDTIIKKQEKKTNIQFEREQNEFIILQERGDMSAKPPVPFQEKNITIDDLAIGDYITVRTNNDAEKDATVTAKVILVNLKETAPVVQGQSMLAARVVGVVGWKGTKEDLRFAIDKPDGVRVQIYINGETQYVKKEEKSKEVFEDEMKLFKSSGGVGIAPLPIAEIKSSYDALTINARVDIEGFGNEKDGITAKKVILMPEQKNI